MGFSLKLFRSRATALPALYGYREVGHFLWEYARGPAIIRAIPTASAAQAREYMQRFCSNDGVSALWRTGPTNDLLGCRTRPIVNFVEHAHNAFLSDTK